MKTENIQRNPKKEYKEQKNTSTKEWEIVKTEKEKKKK